MKRFVFQGDSITDAGRPRENSLLLGNGYPTITAGMIGAAHPCEFEFVNTGISGDRVVDVYSRIKTDIINLKPDYMSLLIGVNDVWHEVAWQNGVDTEKFERVYSWLIDEVKAALPDIKIILLAPYVTRGEAVDEKYAEFQTGVAEKAAAVERIAKKYSLPLVKLQEVFDAAIKTAPPAQWTADGVHPTVAGHTLIAQKLSEEFEKLL